MKKRHEIGKRIKQIPRKFENQSHLAPLLKFNTFTYFSLPAQLPFFATLIVTSLTLPTETRCNFRDSTRANEPRHSVHSERAPLRN